MPREMDAATRIDERRLKDQDVTNAQKVRNIRSSTAEITICYESIDG
jgi:hypothetical protein